MVYGSQVRVGGFGFNYSELRIKGHESGLRGEGLGVEG